MSHIVLRDHWCSLFLDQRKHAKLQWLQNPNQSNVDNVNNISHELADLSGTKRKNVRKLKLMTLKLTVRTRMSETCVGVSVTLRRVTRLEHNE
jgi:hypothetical protein